MILLYKTMLFPKRGLLILQSLLPRLSAPSELKKSHSPADKPITLTQIGESKDDDVVITGVGRFEPGNPVTLTKHTIKEDFSALNKEKMGC